MRRKRKEWKVSICLTRYGAASTKQVRLQLKLVSKFKHVKNCPHTKYLCLRPSYAFAMVLESTGLVYRHSRPFEK